MCAESLQPAHLEEVKGGAKGGLDSVMAGGSDEAAAEPEGDVAWQDSKEDD